MLLLLFGILGIISLVGIRPRKEELHGDALSVEQTTAMRGIFAVIILISHMRGYMAYTGLADAYALKILTFVGQLMVTPFLFYSGYGVALSYDKKNSYVKSFPKNRLFKTWLHFAIPVTFYLILTLVLKNEVTVGKVLLSYMGWDSLGNSNWYVFDTLVLYIISLLAFYITRFVLSRKSTKACAVIVTVFSVIFIMVLRLYRDTWWYDTVLCFPLGWWYYIFKEPLHKALKRRSVYWPTLVLTTALFILYSVYRSRGGFNVYEYNLYGCLFVLIITLVTMKLRVTNPILKWLGDHSFHIYIYMRIPMIILTELGKNTNEYVFSMLSVVGTLILALAMRLLEKPIDKLIFKSVRNKTNE